MIYFAAGAALVLLGGLFWYFRKGRLHRMSVAETLRQFVSLLPLREARFQKYPSPSVTGDYFGFRVSLEGGAKKLETDGRKGFRFLATLELPKALSLRVFLQQEGRKTRFKPIAELKWVPTETDGFQNQFLLLAGDEVRARAVFQPYLCRKILAQNETNWQLDVQGREAHFELWQEFLNGASLSDLLRVVIEALHHLIVTEK